MKRLVFLLLAFVSLTVSGQSVVRRLSPSTVARDSAAASQHIKFMGMPVDGTLASFSKEMAKKGFDYQGRNVFDGTHSDAYRGRFAGYEGCTVRLMSAPEINKVYSVVVAFPYQYQWPGLFSDYAELKKMLTQKYGEPRQCTETFHTSTQPVGDLEKMECVRQNECEYKCHFEAEGGTIVLEIFHAKVAVSHFNMVLLSYIDDANAKLRAAAKGESRGRNPIDDL